VIWSVILIRIDQDLAGESRGIEARSILGGRREEIEVGIGVYVKVNHRR
jgi:hypothetical protein